MATTLIENIIRKILNENFVRFLEGAFIDADGNPIPINLENNGGSGLIPHFAYASDPSGTGFILTTSTELEYIAIKVAAPDAVLTVADFSGLWFHRKGLPGVSIPGADGINGKNGGFPCIYSSDTDETQPDQGGIKFNNANPGLATEMYISAMSPSGMDLTALLNAIPGGAKFMLSTDSPEGSTLAVFQFDESPTNNTGWFTVPITNLAISESAFVDEDPCVFQINGTSNINIDPVTGRLMVDGVDKSGTTAVATFSALPDPTTVPLNVYYVTAQDCFVYANGGEWWPVNGRANIYRASGLPLTVIAPAVLASAIADNGSGKVRVTANSHGLTAGQNNGRIYISGGGTWTAGLYRFTYVSANTYDLPDVTYSGALGTPTVARGNATDEIVVKTVSIPPLTDKSSIEVFVASLYNDSTETKRTVVDWGGVRFFNRNDNTSGNDATYQGPMIINLNSTTLKQATLGIGVAGGKAASSAVPATGSFAHAAATTMNIIAILGNASVPVGTESITYNMIRAAWEV
ncbi:hypothetical protein SAMN06296273_1157 [Nitrosomonas ureae]|uniref:Uncharacterized protein n=1 Tax=Nitrosomonas ureae TaxID=44577 RepID=A0A285BWZ2_9PROT|nr:hypothetical protein [Nitrosomonas ureae]SNX59720.1 hypothetical protein SAMN06296273_1157 [Nitrosomonas ureae]